MYKLIKWKENLQMTYNLQLESMQNPTGDLA